MKRIKRHWKEFLLVLIITLVLSVGVTSIPSSLEDLTRNSLVLLLGVFTVFIPFFAAIVGGYLISRKCKDLNHAVLVPAAAVVLASVLMVGLSLVSLFTATDAQLEQKLSEIKEAGFGMFTGMTVEEFKSFTFSTTIFGFFAIALINFGLGLAGGFVGNAIHQARK